MPLNFGSALVALKTGARVCRQGWNGRNMWLVLVDAEQWAHFDVEIGAYTHRLPWIGMKTADDKFVPWLASQTDILAEDWEVRLT